MINYCGRWVISITVCHALSQDAIKDFTLKKITIITRKLINLFIIEGRSIVIPFATKVND